VVRVREDVSVSKLWTIDPNLLEQTGMTTTEFLEGYHELVQMGLVTETVPETDTEGPSFALAFWPLDNPETFPESVRQKHAENMAKWAGMDAAELTQTRH
jgi:hypothetical protein